MNTKIYAATTVGITGHLVEVEVDLALGLLQFFIVGLPDRAITESRQRITAALKNSGIRLPERKITVNLAPADLKKEGTMFDLPIALGIIRAAGLLDISENYNNETIFIGELSLDGSIRPVRGALAIAADCYRYGKKRLVLPFENAHEVRVIKNLEIVGVSNLVELIEHMRHGAPLRDPQIVTPALEKKELLDFAQVKGQPQAKRALQIAAAGGHNILFVGSPGSGKTMLAQRLATIMPDLTIEEQIEISKLYSISGKLGSGGLVSTRPFRAPHHSISQAGLIGGGSLPQPGEISLGHGGVVFLDELTEFKRTTLEALRQPLEEQSVAIARAQQTVSFPASFLLVAALNPCPCGFFGDSTRKCRCNLNDIQRYIGKLSGPFLDRIDLQVAVHSLDYQTMITTSSQAAVSSAELKETVEAARYLQKNRSRQLNSKMPADQLEKIVNLTDAARIIIQKAFDRLALTMRGYHKLLRVARTIADLEASEQIDTMHIHEALSYRSLDLLLEKMKQQ